MRKTRARHEKVSASTTNIPGYYFDKDKNRYFKLDSPAGSSQHTKIAIDAKEALSKQEKIIHGFQNATISKLKGANRFSSRPFALTHLSLLICDRTLKPKLDYFEMRCNETLTRNFTRRLIYKSTLPTHSQPVILASEWDALDKRLMMLVSCQGYTTLESIYLDGFPTSSSSTIHHALDQVLSGVPSFMHLSDSQDITKIFITFLGSDEPIKTWSYSDYYNTDIIEPLFSAQNSRDIWSCTTDQSKSVCFVSDKKLVRIDPVNSSVSQLREIKLPNTLWSDTLTMASCSSGNIFTGHRNGCIAQFDPRTKTPVSILKEKSSISHILSYSLHEGSNRSDSYVLSSNFASEINLYDLRNLGQIVQSFPGHVNTHQRLKCAIINDNVLISPGSDNFIRGWSLSSGSLIWQKVLPGSPSPTACSVNILDSQNGFLTAHSDQVSFWSR